ncbi:hypothetical protein ACFOYU_07120 [Microvirga sp. GCM10011540]|uniref:hypothetical protein n=1 Tax=Microvirga sp. GCM10011540 TaxID=3317338 RepID=UPI003622605B
MAKKKTKSPSSALGLKLPKDLRKPGWLDELLHSEIGRRILADALVAAAGAAAVALTRHQPVAKKITRAKKATAEAGSEAASVTKKLASSAAEIATETVAGVAQSLLPENAAVPEDKDTAEGKQSKKRRKKDKAETR